MSETIPLVRAGAIRVAVLAALVAVLGLGVWRSMPTPGEPVAGMGPKADDARAEPLFPQLAGPGIAAIREIALVQGDLRLVVRRSGDAWEVVENTGPGAGAAPPGQRLSPDAGTVVDDVLHALAQTRRLERFAVPAASLSQYGLAPPRRTMTLRGEGDLELHLGERNPAATGLYVHLPATGEVALTGALLDWEASKLAAIATGRAP